MKRALVVMAAAQAAWFGGNALAQDAGLEDSAYWRIGGGVTFMKDLRQDITYNPNQLFPAIPLASEQHIDMNKGFIAGAALGFDYADGIRTELEYRYTSVSIDSFTPVGGVRAGIPAPVSDNFGAHFIFSNFYFDFHNDSAFTPFIGGGVGGAFVTNENGDSDAALAYQGRAGISVAIGGGFLADVEYIYARTNKLVYGPNDEDFTADGAPLRIDGDYYQASSVMVSLRRPF